MVNASHWVRQMAHNEAVPADIIRQAKQVRPPLLSLGPALTYTPSGPARVQVQLLNR